jgi:hypothetical protein
LVLSAGGEDGRHEDYAKESEDEREGQGLKHGCAFHIFYGI